MNSYLFTQAIEQVSPDDSIHALEQGSVLFFPEYFFSDVDPSLLTETILDGSRKNISYDVHKQKLMAHRKDSQELELKLTHMMQHFAEFSMALIQKTLPSYAAHLDWGRTSFRPAEVDGRSLSKRKDDTRLHVDSFAASPVYGKRILRVFCNINPYHKPRVWHIGEPFSHVLQRFAPQIVSYSKLKATLFYWIKTTKSLRSAYDHYMLQLHDKMKLDDHYQNKIKKIKVDFPAQSCWIVFTDQVSHAALSGQYLLEQTFYLPVNKMQYPEQSPLRQWQKIKPEVHALV